MASVDLKENESWKDFIQNEYTIIDCYGDNCAACVMLEPIFTELADEFTGISWGRVNISKLPDIADTHSINAMPTTLFFRKGELIDKVIGSVEKEELLFHVASLLYE